MDQSSGSAPASSGLHVPPEIVESAIESVGRSFEPLNGSRAEPQGRDHVDDPIRLRRTLRRIGRRYPLRLETLGERRFLERFGRPLVFQNRALEAYAGLSIRFLQRFNAFNWIGRTLVALQAHDPIVLIATRSAE